ncbi:MAG: hypothetical protein C4558_06520 [Dehalococcoidia bacterium]|nr:MAG: hypothetical protein C4558_06520 [Dehalococcoidia bacterium]
MGEPDRLEREIEEILGKIENFPGPEARRARKPLSRPVGDAVVKRQRAMVRELSRISVSQVMLFSFLLILGSFFFREAGIVAAWALYGGVILFVVSFAIMMFGNRGRFSPSHQETVWRGRNVSYGTYARPTVRGRVAGQSAPTLLIRIRRWWAHRMNRSRS